MREAEGVVLSPGWLEVGVSKEFLLLFVRHVDVAHFEDLFCGVECHFLTDGVFVDPVAASCAGTVFFWRSGIALSEGLEGFLDSRPLG